MANNLTLEAAKGLLDHINGKAAYDVVAPLKAALMVYTDVGSKTDDGTEVTGNGYVRQTVTVTLASNAETATNSASILFPDMPNVTVGGWAIYDSSPTPKRLWWGAPSRLRTVPLGDSYEIKPGDLVLELH